MLHTSPASIFMLRECVHALAINSNLTEREKNALIPYLLCGRFSSNIDEKLCRSDPNIVIKAVFIRTNFFLRGNFILNSATRSLIISFNGTYFKHHKTTFSYCFWFTKYSLFFQFSRASLSEPWSSFEGLKETENNQPDVDPH